MFHVKHEWGGWVGEVDYLASTMSSPGVIEGLVFHVKRGGLAECSVVVRCFTWNMGGDVRVVVGIKELYLGVYGG